MIPYSLNSNIYGDFKENYFETIKNSYESI